MNKQLKNALSELSAEMTPAEHTEAIAELKALRMAKREEQRAARRELLEQADALKEKRNRGGKASSDEEKPRRKGKKGKRGKRSKAAEE